MKQETLSEYKNKLEKERLLLLEEIKQSEKPVDFGDDVDGFEEEGNEAQEFGDHLAISRDLKLRLDEIDVALSKIKNGEYGKCEKCGNEIEGSVLGISPEARFCKECELKTEN